MFDRYVELCSFYAGDQVLALLPVVNLPFQAKYSGPDKVVHKLRDENYQIATPDRRKRTQLCHVNILKPYYDRDSTKPVMTVHQSGISTPSSPTVAEWEREEMKSLDDCMLQA